MKVQSTRQFAYPSVIRQNISQFVGQPANERLNPNKPPYIKPMFLVFQVTFSSWSGTTSCRPPNSRSQTRAKIVRSVESLARGSEGSPSVRTSLGKYLLTRCRLSVLMLSMICAARSIGFIPRESFLSQRLLHCLYVRPLK